MGALRRFILYNRALPSTEWYLGQAEDKGLPVEDRRKALEQAVSFRQELRDIAGRKNDPQTSRKARELLARIEKLSPTRSPSVDSHP